MTMLQSQATAVKDRLYESRMMARLTTREIAPLVGVSQTTISKWERGQGEPTITQFVLWARATKQPVSALLDGLEFELSSRLGESNPGPIHYKTIACTLALLLAAIKAVRA